MGLFSQKFNKKNIHVRPLEESDFEVFFGLYSDPKVMQFIGKPMSRNQVKLLFKQVLHDYFSEKPKQLIYAIENIALKEVTGVVGFLWHEKNIKLGDLGIMLVPKKTQKGTGKYAMQLFISHLFNTTEVRQINCQVALDNRAAYLVAKAVGFQFQSCNKTELTQDKISHEGVIKKVNWEH